MIPSRTQLPLLVQRTVSRLLRADPTLELPLPRAQAVRVLTSIAYKNFRSGRYARFCKHEKGQSKLTPTRYVERLIRTWIREAVRWNELHEGDNSAWSDFRGALTQAATRMLPAIGVNTSDHAEDYASSAYILIRRAEYPFDVPLDSWAFAILRNEILNRHPRKDAIRHTTISIDEPVRTDGASETAREWQIADLHAQVLLEGVEDRDLIEQLLRCLVPTRRAVIILTFFEQLTDGEIAERLATSHDNVQTLRHRALDQMYQRLDSELVSAHGGTQHQHKGRDDELRRPRSVSSSTSNRQVKRTRRDSGGAETRKKK